LKQPAPRPRPSRGRSAIGRAYRPGASTAAGRMGAGRTTPGARLGARSARPKRRNGPPRPRLAQPAHIDVRRTTARRRRGAGRRARDKGWGDLPAQGAAERARVKPTVGTHVAGLAGVAWLGPGGGRSKDSVPLRSPCRTPRPASRTQFLWFGQGNALGLSPARRQARAHHLVDQGRAMRPERRCPRVGRTWSWVISFVRRGRGIDLAEVARATTGRGLQDPAAGQLGEPSRPSPWIQTAGWPEDPGSTPPFFGRRADLNHAGPARRYGQEPSRVGEPPCPTPPVPRIPSRR